MAVDWFDPDFGHGRVHIGTTVSDGHDRDEERAEEGR